MPKILDLIGQRFGRLTVISTYGSVSSGSKRSARAWNCRCDCGADYTVITTSLTSGNTRSCGCIVREHIAKIGRGHTHATRLIDLTGKSFGLLTAVAPTQQRVGGAVVWICRCDCGETTAVSVGHLRSGDTRSCGCTRADALVVHGATRRKIWTPEYRTWAAMLQRCLNPNQPAYPRYGGRGIGVCERWLTFANFRSDMGARPKGMTIDRIDNSRGYEPGNCKWSTQVEQQRNRRSNRTITWNGETKCVSEWAEQTGLKPRTIVNRLNRGWSAAQALTTLVRSHD